MKRIEDGIYTLENAQNHEYLDLNDGLWDQGQVQTWQTGSHPRLSHAQHNQRWIIANVPNTNEYQIINAHYGVLVGKFPGQRWDDWFVKAGPISTDYLGTRWIAEGVGEGHVRFKWRMDSARCLAIIRDGAHQAATILPEINHLTQAWHLHRDSSLDTPVNPLAGWLSSVPATTRLTHLNIPGTHQSLSLHGLGRIPGIADFAQGPEGHEYPPVWTIPAYRRLIYGGDNARCQNRAPYEQLLEGIRYLDLSFDRWSGNKEQSGSLYARHGVASLGYSLAAVLQSLKIFLARFPSETVLLQIRNETHTGGFEAAWAVDFAHFADIFYMPDHDSAGLRAADLTLGQVCGKVMCPAMLWGERTSIWSIGLGPQMPQDPRYAYIVEDSFNLELKDTQRKVQLCRNNIERAKNDRNPRHWYKTAFNMSIFSKYNPIDAVYTLKEYAKEICKEENLGTGGQHRIGIVCFDFYEYNLEAIEALVASNSRS